MERGLARVLLVGQGGLAQDDPGGPAMVMVMRANAPWGAACGSWGRWGIASTSWLFQYRWAGAAHGYCWSRGVSGCASMRGLA